jgi:hypothetical protein
VAPGALPLIFATVLLAYAPPLARGVPDEDRAQRVLGHVAQLALQSLDGLYLVALSELSKCGMIVDLWSTLRFCRFDLFLCGFTLLRNDLRGLFFRLLSFLGGCGLRLTPIALLDTKLPGSITTPVDRWAWPANFPLASTSADNVKTCKPTRLVALMVKLS